MSTKALVCYFSGIGPYVEVAFFHKKSKSLLVTDAVIFVPERPPKVVSVEALLSAARNGLAVKILSAGKVVPDDPILDTPGNRQKGNKRFIVLECGLVLINSPKRKASYVPLDLREEEMMMAHG